MSEESTEGGKEKPAATEADANAPAEKPPRSKGRPDITEETVFTGELLQRVREAQGVSLKEISDRTRINTRILKALEAERFEDMPGARVYVRGFVRCFAQELGLDQDLVSRTYVPKWERWFDNQNLE